MVGAACSLCLCRWCELVCSGFVPIDINVWEHTFCVLLLCRNLEKDLKQVFEIVHPPKVVPSSLGWSGEDIARAAGYVSNAVDAWFVSRNEKDESQDSGQRGIKT